MLDGTSPDNSSTDGAALIYVGRVTSAWRNFSHCTRGVRLGKKVRRPVQDRTGPRQSGRRLKAKEHS